MLQSAPNQMIKLVKVSYTGRNLIERISQMRDVYTSQETYRIGRLFIFLLIDVLMGFCLAHLLRQFFLTPHRSIGNQYAYWIGLRGPINGITDIFELNFDVYRIICYVSRSTILISFCSIYI